MERRGFNTTFVDLEEAGGPHLATLVESIYSGHPGATLDYVQRELAEFAIVLAEFQDEYGEDAPLAVIA